MLRCEKSQASQVFVYELMKCLDIYYFFVFKKGLFIRLPENEWKFLSSDVLWGTLKLDSQSQIFSLYLSSSLHNFTIMIGIVNKPNICSKNGGILSRRYDPRRISIYYWCSQSKPNIVLRTCMTYKVIASIGKDILTHIVGPNTTYESDCTSG